MILRLAFGNWISRAYLLLVVTVAVFVTVSVLTWNGPDANLAGVWLVFVTLPFSLTGTLAADTSAGFPVLIAAVSLGALVNAVLLGAAVRLSRRRT